MTFLKLDCRPDLALDFDALCVWVQIDVWRTHVFVLMEDSDAAYGVEMFSVRQEEKGQRADDEAIEDGVLDGADDSGSFDSLGEALQTIANGSPITFPENDPLGLRAAWEEAKESERVQNMSSYARKVYLREKGA